MHYTGHLGLVHWDDPEGWYGEGGERRVQVRVWVKSDGDQGVLSDRQVVVSGEDGGPKPLLGRQLGRTHREPGRDMQTRDS